jgi:hypothetical protein
MALVTPDSALARRHQKFFLKQQFSMVLPISK